MSWFEDFKLSFIKCFIREDRYKLLIEGLGVTIKISLLAVVIGMAIGLLIALCKLSKHKPLNLIGKVYTDIIRFGINSGAYQSEIIRGGILSVDKGQTEAGRSLGLSESQTMINIIIPQAIKNILPAFGNEFITLVKETSIVGYIGLMDLQKAADFIKSATYKPAMPLFGVAIIYFVLIKILTILLGLFEKRLRKADQR